MATAIIFGAPGSGKTVNATTVPGKTLLLCSDNSSIVLRNFDRPNLEIVEVTSFKDYLEKFEAATTTHKYDTVITDCLTDLIDGYIVECRLSGKFQDIRQAYNLAYTHIKDVARKAAHATTDCIFNCWEDSESVTLPSGELVTRVSPMLPAKIKQQVCGLCNVIAYVTSKIDEKGNRVWGYLTEPSQTMMCKDQLGCRKGCKPAEIFKYEVKK